MAAESTNAMEVFYSYAHKDEYWRKKLVTHLSTLERQGVIAGWHDRNISAGTAWATQIDKHLNSADIILLLISPDFIASDYCYSLEATRAMERHQAGTARVIPIMLHPTDWHGLPFEHLQALPTNAKAITTWSNRNQALLDVAQGIRTVADELRTRRNSHKAPVSSTVRAQASPTASSSSLWNIPYPRNPLFIGREAVLTTLHERLSAGQPMALTQAQAISGLGGIGKTQTAIEYAYRYRESYQLVLWVNADTRETLAKDFVTIAGMLRLPEKDEQDQNRIVLAVTRWLEAHEGWLLIFDNADDLYVISPFLPTRGKGHVLLTTRAHAVGMLAQSVEIEQMDPQEGALLLLRRAKLIPGDAFLDAVSAPLRTTAIDIVEELGGLPLALDQAGAYIEESACSLSDYLHLYRTSRADLLRARGDLPLHHPEPVATTWAMALTKVQHTNPAALDILNLCAFLAPDAIPEELFFQASLDDDSTPQPLIQDQQALNAAIKTLLTFSLIRRHAETRTLSIHRLVQAVVKDDMNATSQSQWAERAVRAINKEFPYAEVATMEQCQRYLLHALACAEYIKAWKMVFPEAARLLQQAGSSLYQRAQYREAEPLYQQALAMYEHIRGADHTETADSLIYLAVLYEEQGKYEQAEPLYQRALAIYERVRGPDHPDTAMALSNLTKLYNDQGKYEQAEPLLQRALVIRERMLGPDHPSTADTLNNLAILHKNQGKYEQAESLYQRALAIYERAQRANHPTAANTLNNLASLYYNQDKYEQAEPLYQRALAIYERMRGPDHPNTANMLNNLAILYRVQGKYEQAEPLFQRALAIRERVFGADHFRTLVTLESYAVLLEKTNRQAEAAKLKAQVKAARAKHNI